MNLKYYQESGEINYLFYGIGIGLLLITTVILGYLYAMLIFHIPFIYFNFIATVGFGIALAYLLRIIIRISKNRNKQSRIWLAVLAILFATYFQWVAFLDSVLLEHFPAPQEYLSSLGSILNPGDFFSLIGEINKYGTWSLGAADIPVNGIILALIWVVEIFITAVPSVSLIRSFHITPFSEQFDKWYPKYILDRDFESMTSKSAIEAKLDQGVLETLRQLKEGNGVKHSKIYLYYLEGEEKQYLSINRIYIGTGGGGKTTKSHVISNYHLSSAEAQKIMQEFKKKKSIAL